MVLCVILATALLVEGAATVLVWVWVARVLRESQALVMASQSLVKEAKVLVRIAQGHGQLTDAQRHRVTAFLSQTKEVVAKDAELVQQLPQLVADELRNPRG